MDNKKEEMNDVCKHRSYTLSKDSEYKPIKASVFNNSGYKKELNVRN